MKKIINNKYFIFLLLFLYDWVAFAHDCSSPGDCEETAGYNSAVAIVGGVIAVAVGVMSSGMTPNEPTIDEDINEDNNDDTDQDVTDEEMTDEEIDELFEDEDLDDFKEEIDDADEELTDEEIEELFEDEDLDDFEEEIDDTDEEMTDEEIEELFEDEDIDDFEEKITDEELDELKEEINDELDKATTEKQFDEITTEEGSSGDLLDETQKVISTSNNIKSLLESASTLGIKLWQGLLKGEEYKKAAQRYKDILSNLENKGLGNLANKYYTKLNTLLQGKADKLIIAKTKGVKSLFKNMKKIKSLGHLADALTLINNLNKKFKNAKQTDEQVGAIAEEILRLGIKKGLAKYFPPIAIADAIMSLAGGPNLDFVIDKSIDTYKEGVSKATEWVYTPNKSDNQKFVEAFQKRKANINKLNIPEADKKIRLKKIIKILKNNEALWK